MEEKDSKSVTSKVQTIDTITEQIRAYLSLIQKDEIEPASGFSLILKYAKSMTWECEGFLRRKEERS